MIDGLEGDKSVLFYEYLRLLKEIQPKYFLLENIRMRKDSKEELDEELFERFCEENEIEINDLIEGTNNENLDKK